MRALCRSLLLLVVLAGPAVAAEPLIIRLGTLAPLGSPWFNLLVVVKPQDLPGWRKTADVANQVVRGKVVPAPIFDEVQAAARQCRSAAAP